MLFSFFIIVFIFSSAILEGALNLSPLNLPITLIYVAIYALPILILEWSLRRAINNKSSSSDLFNKAIILSLISAFIFVFLFFITVSFTYAPRGEETMAYLAGPPIYFAISLIISLILSYFFVWFNKNKSFKLKFIICAFLLSASIAILTYGLSEQAKCDWNGCGNDDYLSDLAIKQNDSAICNLAKIKWQEPSPRGGIIVPTRFLASSIDDCYANMAKKTKQPAICKLSVSCTTDAAEKNNDPKYCKELESLEKQDHCLFWSAGYPLFNENFCKEISNQQGIENCMRTVSSSKKAWNRE